MQKKLLILLAIIIFGGCFFYVSKYIKKRYFTGYDVESGIFKRDNEPILGVYSLNEEITQQEATAIEHYVLVLNNIDDWNINLQSLQSIPPNQPLLLTIEIWEASILNKIAAGEYDKGLKKLLSKLRETHGNIYLRWQPEMEVPNTKLPWANRGPVYSEAFNKFAEISEEVFPEARLTWGPAGYAGNMGSFPDPLYVEASTITLNSDSEENVQIYKHNTIKEQLQRKLHRMRFVEAPVFILGSRNMDVSEFNSEWLEEAAEKLQKDKKDINFRNIVKNTTNQNYRENEPIIGLYDYNELLVNEEAVSVEHLFINFEQIEEGSFKNSINKVYARNHDVIITVEPIKQDTTILKDLVAGKHDLILQKLYDFISKTNRTIYLRFAHEMEIPIERYPWQSRDPAEYIRAFRYFMQFPDKEMTQIRKVWGPAGDRGSIEWWPGDDVVDIVSLAIYGLPDKNITDPKAQESFSTIYNRKNWRIRFLQKPIFITEFGVKGPEEFQENWLLEAAEVINSHREIMGVNYFNMTDVPKAWGDIKPPDWSITKKTFTRYVNALSLKQKPAEI